MPTVNIIRAQPGHEEIIAQYFSDNAVHLKPWSPLVPKNHHTADAWRRRLLERELEFDGGLSVHFIGIDDSSGQMIGSCSISNIVRGVFQACHMGYSIAEKYQGQGCMKQITEYAINYAFTDLKLHRIMANYMPNNLRSEALLQSLGFEREGYAKQYILINGRWEDHVLTSLINPRDAR